MYVGHTAMDHITTCAGASVINAENTREHTPTLQTCVTLISLIAWSRSPTISAAGRLGGQRSGWISPPGWELSHLLSLFYRFTAAHLQNEDTYLSLQNDVVQLNSCLIEASKWERFIKNTFTHLNLFFVAPISVLQMYLFPVFSSLQSLNYPLLSQFSHPFITSDSNFMVFFYTGKFFV